MTDRVRMTKRDIRGVISAETRAAHRHAMTMTFLPREIEDIIHDDALVGVVRLHPIGRMNRLVVETVEVDRIRAVNRDSSGVDKVSNGPNQSEILVLEIPSERRRIQNQRQAAAVAESEHFKIPAEPRCVRADVTFVDGSEESEERAIEVNDF